MDVNRRVYMHNWRIPGRKPGTSTKVMMGILKASQKRTKRAPFTEELMSKQPDKETEMKDWTANLKTHHSSIIIQLTLPLFHINFQNADKEERWSYAHNTDNVSLDYFTYQKQLWAGYPRCLQCVRSCGRTPPQCFWRSWAWSQRSPSHPLSEEMHAEMFTTCRS